MARAQRRRILAIIGGIPTGRVHTKKYRILKTGT